MLWWELSRAEHAPGRELPRAQEPRLSASIFLFVALGFGLYGGVFIFPLFTQTILHFTPTETGLALLPGGLATAVTALDLRPPAERAASRSSTRACSSCSGVAIFLVAMWKLGHLTTAAGEPDARFALIIRGLGARASCSRRSTTSPTASSSRARRSRRRGSSTSRASSADRSASRCSTRTSRHQIQFHRVDLADERLPLQSASGATRSRR